MATGGSVAARDEPGDFFLAHMFLMGSSLLLFSLFFSLSLFTPFKLSSGS